MKDFWAWKLAWKDCKYSSFVVPSPIRHEICTNLLNSAWNMTSMSNIRWRTFALRLGCSGWSSGLYWHRWTRLNQEKLSGPVDGLLALVLSLGDLANGVKLVLGNGVDTMSFAMTSYWAAGWESETEREATLCVELVACKAWLETRSAFCSSCLIPKPLWQHPALS